MATIANSRRRRFVTVMTAFLAVAIMSVAAAAWLTDGTGTGQATAGEDQNLDVTVEFGTGLVPSTSKTVTVTIKNLNPYKVEIDGISLGSAGISSNITACDATEDNAAGHDVHYEPPAIADDQLVIPAHNGTISGETVVTLTDALAMGADSNDECKSAEFSLPLDVSGFSSDADATPAVTLPAQ